MHRYYMNAETRDALIAESKRMIAAAHAQRTAPRPNATPTAASAWSDTMPAESEEGVHDNDANEGSAFAALVSDLWSASASATLPRVATGATGARRIADRG